jgi:hypothetical protein
LASLIHWLVRESVGKRRWQGEYPVNIKVTGFFKNDIRHDPDNICAKLYIDGLVPVILPDDNNKFVKIVSTEAVSNCKTEWVEILIESVN